MFITSIVHQGEGSECRQEGTMNDEVCLESVSVVDHSPQTDVLVRSIKYSWCLALLLMNRSLLITFIINDHRPYPAVTLMKRNGWGAMCILISRRVIHIGIGCCLAACHVWFWDEAAGI